MWLSSACIEWKQHRGQIGVYKEKKVFYYDKKIAQLKNITFDNHLKAQRSLGGHDPRNSTDQLGKS